MLYPYRCTEQQLPDALKDIEESGDTVEHVVYKGGRDYVLICRKAAEGKPLDSEVVEFLQRQGRP
jgi:hypothetical protein